MGNDRFEEVLMGCKFEFAGTEDGILMGVNPI